MRMKRLDLLLAGVLSGLSFSVACVAAQAAAPETGSGADSDLYIVEAEWISNTDTSTYFQTEDGFLYWTQEPRPELDDRPYLLTMSDNNTPDDRSDDTILVIWAAQ